MSNSPRTTTPPAPRSGEDPPPSNGSFWHKLRNFLRPPPDAEALREVVEEIIEEPLSESGISQAERMLLGNIMNLRERRVGDCMLPRADIISAEISSKLV